MMNGPTPGKPDQLHPRGPIQNSYETNKHQMFWDLVSCFPFEPGLIFRFPLAQINCLARSPFVKPFPVALGQTKSRHIHDQHLSGEGYQKPTAGYDIIFGTF